MHIYVFLCKTLYYLHTTIHFIYITTIECSLSSRERERKRVIFIYTTHLHSDSVMNWARVQIDIVIEIILCPRSVRITFSVNVAFHCFSYCFPRGMTKSFINYYKYTNAAKLNIVSRTYEQRCWWVCVAGCDDFRSNGRHRDVCVDSVIRLNFAILPSLEFKLKNRECWLGDSIWCWGWNGDIYRDSIQSPCGQIHRYVSICDWWACSNRAIILDCDTWAL